jgi:hypothetical protein
MSSDPRQDAFHKCLEAEWEWYLEEWPEYKVERYHRTEIKPIPQINHVKSVILDRLGVVPVFFFLTVLWSSYNCSGPYNKVEKGLLILYQLLEGMYITDMERYIPKSSYYEIYKGWWGKEHDSNRGLDKILTGLLLNMCSSIELRVISSQYCNPIRFKHVTLFLDGHDTRLSYQGHSSESQYSWKLRKSGMRSQVCMDSNGMILFVSKSEPCKDHTDGNMFEKMDIEKKIHKLDCMALDGAYIYYSQQLVERSKLKSYNFIYPIRKPNNQSLSAEESTFNEEFGSFRSAIESKFGNLRTTFKRFNNEKSWKTSEPEKFTLQMKLSWLLINIKDFVKLVNIGPRDVHKHWLIEGFDYPKPHVEKKLDIATSLKEQQTHREMLLNMQREMLLGKSVEEDEEMDDEREYEPEKIMEERIVGRKKEYKVKWKGYLQTTWEPASSMKGFKVLKDYEKRLSKS